MASPYDNSSGNSYHPDDDSMEADTTYIGEYLLESQLGETGVDYGIDWQDRTSRTNRANKPAAKPEPDVRMGQQLLGPDARHPNARRTGGSRELPDGSNTKKDAATRPVLQQSRDGRSSSIPSNRQPQSVRAIEPGAIPTLSQVVAEQQRVSVSQVNKPAPRFTQAVFDATLAKCEFSGQGDFIIRFIVANPSDVDEAIKLRDAYGLSLTLAIARKHHG